MELLKHLRKLVPNIENKNPANIGDEKQQHWTLQDHVVNLMERTKRLVTGINNDIPKVLIKKEIELVEERLSVLKEYYNEEE